MIERDDAEEEPSRGLGWDLLGSTVRGGGDGAIAGLLALLFVGVFQDFGRQTGETVAAALGLVLGGALYGTGSALFRHAPSRFRRRLVLILSALTASVVAGVPFALATERDGELLLAAGFVAGLATGVAQALIGSPIARVEWRNPFARSVLAALYASLLVTGPVALLFLSLHDAELARRLANAGSLAVYGLPFLPLLGRGRRALVEAIARRVRAGKKAPESSRATYSASCRDQMSLAALATDPDARRRFLEQALESARIAHALALTEPDVVPSLCGDRRRYVELLFLLGKTDEIERTLASGEDAPALEAELWRLRGDPERALACAQGALEEGSATDRANAHAVLALAAADLGRFEEARAHLAPLARAQKILAPFVPRFGANAVAKHIARRERGPVTGSPARRVPSPGLM